MMRRIIWYLWKLAGLVNGRILRSCSKIQFLVFSLLESWRWGIANSSSNGSISSLLDIGQRVTMFPMEERPPLFAAFKVFAVHAFTIFRAKNVGLEALTVLLETPRFLAVTSFVVLSYQRKVSYLILFIYVEAVHKFVNARTYTMVQFIYGKFSKKMWQLSVVQGMY